MTLSVQAHAARPLGEQVAPSLSLSVNLALPGFPANMAAMDADARNIAAALTAALPQGTLERLAVILIQGMVSSLSIASNPRARMQ